MNNTIVVPGQVITTESGFLRGHGTYFVETEDETNETTASTLLSSIAGEIERVNKLISVRPIKSRYLGEVGDLIVGRITVVESKRWKVDISSQKDGILQLSSITLPGGVQRMRTYEDQLAMRTLFEENDLICAEIQNINGEGSISLHTRSLKYGKLENGCLVKVPSHLMKRLPQHYVSLPIQCNMDIIFGKNGFIWITRTIPEEWKKQAGNVDDVTPLAETLQNLKQRHNKTPYTKEERLAVARLRNSIEILSDNGIQISPENVYSLYQQSIELKFEPKLMLVDSTVKQLLQFVG
jgi:exosome complex component RRP4